MLLAYISLALLQENPYTNALFSKFVSVVVVHVQRRASCCGADAESMQARNGQFLVQWHITSNRISDREPTSGNMAARERHGGRLLRRLRVSNATAYASQYASWKAYRFARNTVYKFGLIASATLLTTMMRSFGELYASCFLMQTTACPIHKAEAAAMRCHICIGRLISIDEPESRTCIIALRSSNKAWA